MNPPTVPESLPPGRAKAWEELRRAADDQKLVLLPQPRWADDDKVPVIGRREETDGKTTFQPLGLLFDGNEDWLIECWGTRQEPMTYPLRVVAYNDHYLIHRVQRAEVRRGFLHLTCVKNTGRYYRGPKAFLGEAGPLRAATLLRRNGMSNRAQIAYVVGYHNGALGQGSVQLLLRDLDDPRLKTLRDRLLSHDPQL